MDFEALAKQLRKPEGEFGKQIGEKMNISNEAMNLWAIELLNPRSDEHILEIGMGNGGFIKNIVDKDDSIKYVGCDFSEIMIDEAKKLNHQFVENGQVQLVLGDIQNLPLSDNQFDKTFTVNTIYFWNDPIMVLAQIHRVLKPKGKLLIALRPKSVMKSYPFVQYGFNLYEKSDLEELLSGNGFTVTSVNEKREPDQEINGQMIRVDSLIVIAEKLY